MPVGILFDLAGRPARDTLDPRAPWAACGAMPCLAMTVAILAGGIGHLPGRGGAKTPALPTPLPAHLPTAPPAGQPTGLLIASDALPSSPPPRRGAAFLLPWLLWLLVAPTLMAMLGISGPFGPDTPLGFALGFAGLMALAAVAIARVVRRELLSGRPGYSFGNAARYFRTGSYD